MVNADRIEELEEQIQALKRQWPAHSVPPSLLQRLDDLEDELELERKKVAEGKVDA
jgi:ATP phosphoribosyltransferase regulatory subunit HisZ